MPTRDAHIGDELVLVSHDPFMLNLPYRSSSPIFLHRDDCGPHHATEELPGQLTSRHLSVRSFDANEMMVDATVVGGTELRSTIATLFADWCRITSTSTMQLKVVGPWRSNGRPHRSDGCQELFRFGVLE